MKRITKQETLPALAVPEVLSVPELAYPARLGKRSARRASGSSISASSPRS